MEAYSEVKEHREFQCTALSLFQYKCNVSATDLPLRELKLK